MQRMTAMAYYPFVGHVKRYLTRRQFKDQCRTAYGSPPQYENGVKAKTECEFYI